MIAPTHITFAEFIYLLILTTTGVPLSAVNVITVALSSIIPDVDTAASRIGKVLPFISHRIERRFGHRTLTHSLVFWSVLSAALFALHIGLTWTGIPLGAQDISICLSVGYLTHPLLDTMTVHGVKLFYPFSGVKCVFPLEVNNPQRYRVQTGSRQDITLCIFFLMACMPTYLVANQGYERFIRSAQKNVESAVRDYNEFSKTHFVTADLIAHNLFSKERLAGTFQVAGALDDHTLLFIGHDNRLHTLGKEYLAEYAVEEVICNRTEPAATRIRIVDMADRPLLQLPGMFDPGSTTHLFGTLKTEDQVGVPRQRTSFNPIAGGGGELQLKYATYGDIQELGLEHVIPIAGELTLRIITPVPVTATEETLSTGEISPGKRYVRISFEAPLDESVRILVQRGDSVKEGDTLALRGLADIPKRKKELTVEQLSVLLEQRDVRLLEIDNRLAQCRQQLERDSSAWLLKRDLVRIGFSAPLSLADAEQSYDKAKQKLQALIESERVLEKEYSVRISRLKREIESYTVKEHAAAEKSETRSTASGVVLEIRRLPHNGKMQTTFVIERQ